MEPSVQKDDFAKSMGAVARAILGEPDQIIRAKREMRYGTRGSLCIALDKGTWFDNEVGEGGGVLAFVMREKSLDKPGALEWLEQHGYIKPIERRSREVAAYNYVSASDVLLFQVVRFEPKTFRQRSPNGHGGFAWTMKGVDRVIYRLPRVIAAIKMGETIYIAEGEKGVLALESIGVVGTCSPGGAGKWNDKYDAVFRGASVVVLPDNDPQALDEYGEPKFGSDGKPIFPGQDHAADVATHLTGIATSVRVLMIPGLPIKGDVADWVAAGGTADQLRALSRGTAEAPPKTNGYANGHFHAEYINGHTDAPSAHAEEEYGQISPFKNGQPVIEILPPEFADDSLALNFSDNYGASLRYVNAWGRWFRWSGQVWLHDDTLMVYDLCRRTCRAYAVNAPPVTQKAITSGKTIASVEKLIRADRRHAATVDQWDDDPWLLNTPNGIIDLRTREVMPHDPLYHMTKCTSVGPDVESGCPLWLKFLERVTNGDALLQSFLQRVCGYCLTGITRDHAMFFAYGTGRNGKGVFLNTIVSIMGDYAMTADPDTFTTSGTGKHLTVLARLQGARLVVAQETEEGVPWAEARIKSITGGDPITANYMRQDHFTYTPQFKLFMAGNHKPGIRSVDEAIKARFNLVPFVVTIPKEERDETLTEKLAAERPAILQWMIDGCWDWQQVKLRAPLVVANATGEYFNDEDAIGLWIAEACEVRSTFEGIAAALFKSWVKWALAAGEQPHSQKRFSQSLASRGFPTVRGTGGIRFVKGLQLPTPRPHHETDNDRD